MSSFIIVFILLLTFVNLRTNAISLFHPIHISVVNLDFSTDKPIIFSVKLFKDDFAKILNQINETQIEFTEKTRKEEVEAFIVDYVRVNLVIGAFKDYKLTKINVSDVAVWLYFEVKQTNSKIDKIQIKNSLMCDLYQDQTNLFIMNYKGEDLAQRFDNSLINYTFKLDK